MIRTQLRSEMTSRVLFQELGARKHVMICFTWQNLEKMLSIETCASIIQYEAKMTSVRHVKLITFKTLLENRSRRLHLLNQIYFFF